MHIDPPPAWVHARRVVMGNRLREARTAGGLTQEQLAERAGIDRKTVVRLESATSDARMSVWLLLAHACGVSLTQLVRE